MPNNLTISGRILSPKSVLLTLDYQKQGKIVVHDNDNTPGGRDGKYIRSLFYLIMKHESGLCVGTIQCGLSFLKGMAR